MFSDVEVAGNIDIGPAGCALFQVHAPCSVIVQTTAVAHSVMALIELVIGKW